MHALWAFPVIALVLFAAFELLDRKTNIFRDDREPQQSDIRDDYLP